jgi:hypothetical protein
VAGKLFMCLIKLCVRVCAVFWYCANLCELDFVCVRVCGSYVPRTLELFLFFNCRKNPLYTLVHTHNYIVPRDPAKFKN